MICVDMLYRPLPLGRALMISLALHICVCSVPNHHRRSVQYRESVLKFWYYLLHSKKKDKECQDIMRDRLTRSDRKQAWTRDTNPSLHTGMFHDRRGLNVAFTRQVRRCRSRRLGFPCYELIHCMLICLVCTSGHRSLASSRKRCIVNDTMFLLVTVGTWFIPGTLNFRRKSRIHRVNARCR